MSEKAPTVTVKMPNWDPPKGWLRHIYATTYKGQPWRFESGKWYEVPREFYLDVLVKVHQRPTDTNEDGMGYLTKSAFIMRENDQVRDEAAEAKKRIVEGTAEHPVPYRAPASARVEQPTLRPHFSDEPEADPALADPSDVTAQPPSSAGPRPPPPEGKQDQHQVGRRDKKRGHKGFGKSGR